MSPLDLNASFKCETLRFGSRFALTKHDNIQIATDTMTSQELRVHDHTRRLILKKCSDSWEHWHDPQRVKYHARNSRNSPARSAEDPHLLEAKESYRQDNSGRSPTLNEQLHASPISLREHSTKETLAGHGRSPPLDCSEDVATVMAKIVYDLVMEPGHQIRYSEFSYMFSESFGTHSVEIFNLLVRLGQLVEQSSSQANQSQWCFTQSTFAEQRNQKGTSFTASTSNGSYAQTYEETSEIFWQPRSPLRSVHPVTSNSSEIDFPEPLFSAISRRNGSVRNREAFESQEFADLGISMSRMPKTPSPETWQARRLNMLEAPTPPQPPPKDSTRGDEAFCLDEACCAALNTAACNRDRGTLCYRHKYTFNVPSVVGNKEIVTRNDNGGSMGIRSLKKPRSLFNLKFQRPNLFRLARIGEG